MSIRLMTTVHQRRPTMVDTIPTVRATVAVRTMAVTIVVLRKWARDLEIAIPAGRKVTGPGSARRNRPMRKMGSVQLGLIGRMMKVPAGMHSVERLSDSWGMGDLTAV